MPTRAREEGNGSMGLKHSTVLGRRKRIRGGALPDKGIATEVSDEAIAVDKVAGKSLLMRGVTLIEYVLLISVVSLVICVAGPPVAEAIQEQFGKIEEVISNGTSGGSVGGGGDLPGGGSGNEQGGGGENPDKPGGGDAGGGTDPEKPGGGNTGGDTGGDPKPEKKKLEGTIELPALFAGRSATATPKGVSEGAVLAYTWSVDGAAVEGAGGPSWTPSAAHIGKGVAVSATDTSGKYEGSISSATATVGQLELTGTLSLSPVVVGKAASATVDGAPADAVLDYEWTVDGKTVCGAGTWTPGVEHAGKTASVEITDATGTYGGALCAEAVVGQMNLSGTVSIDPAPLVGETVTATVGGAPSDAALSYKWKLDGVEVAGAAGPGYLPKKEDYRKTLTVEVTDASGVYAGSLASSGASLDASWSGGTDEQVAALVKANDEGRLSLYDFWKSGDTRSVKLSAMETISGIDETHAAQSVEYVLSDPGHYELTDGSRCAFTVIQKDCLKETGKMNTSDTNRGGWEAAPRRTWCNTTYRNALPAGLKPIFKQFKVTTANGMGSGTTVSTDYFSLFSEKEVFGIPSYANFMAESANAQLDYFMTSGNRIKKADYRAYTWWERSPCRDGSHYFCCVGSDGGAYNGSAYYTYGLAPFGCIGSVPGMTGEVNIDFPVEGEGTAANVSGIPSDANAAYQWMIDGFPVEGATAATYTPESSDFREMLSVRITDASGAYAGFIESRPVQVLASWSKSADERVAETVSMADRGEIRLTDYWKSGDTRTVKLSSMGTISGISESHAAQSVEYVLSDPGHYELADGSRCAFTVIQKDCLKEEGEMNKLDTNRGGWEAAPRRTWCNTTYRNALPAGLKPIFKQFKVTTANGPGSGTTVSTDYFSLFSEKEVFGTTIYADATAESANAQLDYFMTSGNRVKKRNGSASYWWERSPYSVGSYYFCSVDSDGNAYINGTGIACGLAPFGCI